MPIGPGETNLREILREIRLLALAMDRVRVFRTKFVRVAKMQTNIVDGSTVAGVRHSRP